MNDSKNSWVLCDRYKIQEYEDHTGDEGFVIIFWKDGYKFTYGALFKSAEEAKEFVLKYVRIE